MTLNPKAATLACVVVLLAGCGGGNTAEESTTPAPSSTASSSGTPSTSTSSATIEPLTSTSCEDFAAAAKALKQDAASQMSSDPVTTSAPNGCVISFFDHGVSAELQVSVFPTTDEEPRTVVDARAAWKSQLGSKLTKEHAGVVADGWTLGYTWQEAYTSHGSDYEQAHVAFYLITDSQSLRCAVSALSEPNKPLGDADVTAPAFGSVELCEAVRTALEGDD